ncbi:unnamed protein product, partial [Prorocentrum cordatum]
MAAAPMIQKTEKLRPRGACRAAAGPQTIQRSSTNWRRRYCRWSKSSLIFRCSLYERTGRTWLSWAWRPKALGASRRGQQRRLCGTLWQAERSPISTAECYTTRGVLPRLFAVRATELYAKGRHPPRDPWHFYVGDPSKHSGPAQNNDKSFVDEMAKCIINLGEAVMSLMSPTTDALSASHLDPGSQKPPPPPPGGKVPGTERVPLRLESQPVMEGYYSNSAKGPHSVHEPIKPIGKIGAPAIPVPDYVNVNPDEFATFRNEKGGRSGRMGRPSVRFNLLRRRRDTHARHAQSKRRCRLLCLVGRFHGPHHRDWQPEREVRRTVRSIA